MSLALTDPAEIGSRESRGRPAPDSWLVLIPLAMALAAISMWVLPDQIGYDPYSWAIFGREIAHLHLDTRHAATAVKPLPMFFDALFAFTGSHLPGVWMFAARTGDVLAFGAIFRLARRLGGLPAAIVAIAGFAVSGQLLGYLFMRSMSEPMCAATMVATVDFYLLKRYRLALVCLLATAYLRPEAWPILLVYLPWMAWRFGWVRRLVALAIAVFVPFSWFLLDWFGARQFRRSADAATRESQGGPLLHHNPGIAVIKETWALASGPIVVLFIVGLVASLIVWWRAGHSLDPGHMPVPFVVSLFATVWLVIDAVLAQGRFATGAPRYLLPAEALACVTVGWFVVTAAKWVSARRTGSVTAHRWVATVAAAAVLGALVPSLVSAARFWHAGARDGRQYAELGPHLDGAIKAAGGRDAILRCGTLVTQIFQVPLMAWTLHLHLEQVQVFVTSAPGIDFQQLGKPKVPAAFHDQYRLIYNSGGPEKGAFRVLSTC